MERNQSNDFTLPQFQDQSQILINILNKKSVKKIKDLMHVSDNIATLNYARYRSYQPEHTIENAKSTLFAFDGDVYKGLESSSFGKKDIAFAQKHLRVLSGLYGILKPLDLIQPYRLEMGTRLKNRRGKNLYEFWGDRITKMINQELIQNDNDLIVNLASQEYFKSINKKKLNADLLDVNFKEFRNGKYVFVSFSAKRARGMMARYIIKNKITDKNKIIGFDYDGYEYNDELSSEKEYIFTK